MQPRTGRRSPLGCNRAAPAPEPSVPPPFTNLEELEQPRAAGCTTFPACCARFRGGSNGCTCRLLSRPRGLLRNSSGSASVTSLIGRPPRLPRSSRRRSSGDAAADLVELAEFQRWVRALDVEAIAAAGPSSNTILHICRVTHISIQRSHARRSQGAQSGASTQEFTQVCAVGSGAQHVGAQKSRRQERTQFRFPRIPSITWR